MNYPRAGIKRDRKSVSVWTDDTNDGELKQFRCINCGKVVFEYYSNVKLIVPGQNSIAAPQVIECHGKKECYGDDGRTYENCNFKYWIN